MPRIMVIGISDAGPDSLPPCLLKRVTEAEVLCGGQRHLAFFPQVAGERWVVRDNLSELVARLKADAATKRIVVLASGDPYFYGIGSYLARHIPREWLGLRKKLPLCLPRLSAPRCRRSSPPLTRWC